jgi:pimeloyl-ACP methyl ester carboxylesterase
VPVEREIVSREPEQRDERPPLLFVHGAYHGAWCWDEYWLPELARRGWSAHAVSLRGHGESEGKDRLHRWSLRDYEHDVMQAIVSLPRRPVLIGHSMGSLVVERVLERYPARAAALLTPLGPRHGWGTARVLARRDPLGFAVATAGRSLPLRERHLFSGGDGHGFIARMDEESRIVQWQLLLPRRRREARCPVLVMGAENDGLVHALDAVETAIRYGADLRFFPAMGHDLMLEPRWAEPLDALLAWLNGL